MHRKPRKGRQWGSERPAKSQRHLSSPRGRRGEADQRYPSPHLQAHHPIQSTSQQLIQRPRSLPPSLGGSTYSPLGKGCLDTLPPITSTGQLWHLAQLTPQEDPGAGDSPRAPLSPAVKYRTKCPEAETFAVGKTKGPSRLHPLESHPGGLGRCSSLRGRQGRSGEDRSATWGSALGYRGDCSARGTHVGP